MTYWRGQKSPDYNRIYYHLTIYLICIACRAICRSIIANFTYLNLQLYKSNQL